MTHSDSDEKTQAERIARLLDSSLDRLSPAVLETLRSNRERALEHQRVRPPISGFGALTLRWPLASHHQHLLALIPLLLLLLVGTLTYWKQSRPHDVSHIDMAILTDEMPIEVFVDIDHP